MKFWFLLLWTCFAVGADHPVDPNDCDELLRQLARNEWGYPRGLEGSEPPQREELPLDIESLEEFYARFLGGERYGQTDRPGKDAKGEGSSGEADHDQRL